MVVTLAEVKKLLRITDGYTTAETITFSSLAYQKLANKGNVNIILVSADTKNTTSTGSTHLTSVNYYSTVNAGGYTILRKMDSSTRSDNETVYVTYTYNENDEYINALIPQVQADLIEYLNNNFGDVQTRYSSPALKFVSSGPYITDSDANLSSEGFSTGMDIYVDGTERNRGAYSISSFQSSRIKLSTNDSVLAEESTKVYGGVIPRITRIKWPIGIKNIVAQIIWFNIDQAKSANVKSKSIGPTSITYTGLGSGAYPDHIYRALAKYRNVRTK